MLWDNVAQRHVDSYLSILPIQDVLANLSAKQPDYFEFREDQGPTKSELGAWSKRVGRAFDDTPAACIGIWGDLAPTTRLESILLMAWTMLNGPDREKHWFCTLGKRQLCRCGCFGRCTFDLIFKCLAWCFECLLTSTHPWLAPLQKPFKEGSRRWNNRGKKLGFGGACLGKFADWAWWKQAC